MIINYVLLNRIRLSIPILYVDISEGTNEVRIEARR